MDWNIVTFVAQHRQLCFLCDNKTIKQTNRANVLPLLDSLHF